MKHRVFEDIPLRRGILLMVGAGTLWLIWWHFIIGKYWEIIDGFFPFGDGFNPPSICLMILSILTLFFLFGIFLLLQKSKYTKWIVELMDYFGKNTLYIFLYHKFFLDFILCRYVIIDNILLKWIIYFGVMIIGSVVLGMVKNKVVEIILWISRGEKHR